VPPFSFPEEGFAQTVGKDTAEMLLAYEAPRLFQDRAGEILTGFTIRPEDAAAVAQICRRLDGIPLAVELAAARIRELSAPQIAARLDERFHLLTGGASSTTHRQKLRAAIDWSNELLSEAEQTLLARLSVFASGWDLEAAEEVCSGGVVAERSVPDLLTGLIDNSWVVGETKEGSDPVAVAMARLARGVRERDAGTVRPSEQTGSTAARHVPGGYRCRKCRPGR
jgi:predicted ATPase